MDHAVPNVTSLNQSAGKVTKAKRLNWRLVLALGVNLGLWGGIILGVRALLD